MRFAPLLLLPGGLALLAGLDAALTLAGLPAPAGSARLASIHGSLMVLGFLGTVIALERAVALRRPWGLLAPGLLGAGALALVVLPDPLLGRLLLTQGMLVLVLVYAVLWRRNEDPTVAVQALGAVLATGAALLLTRVPVADVLALLVGFVVLTIAAERVELARLAMPPGAGGRLVALTVPLSLAALATLLWPTAAGRITAVLLLALTLWLLRHDVARRTINATGLPRFAAAALLAGYAWLMVAGLLLLATGRPQGVVYDVVVHSVFLGYAMSMVLAHAPVILPAVLRVRLPYTPWMWAPLALLHATLLVRVVAALLSGVASAPDGTVATWTGAAGGNVAALLLFVLTAVATALAAARRPVRPARRPVRPPARTLSRTVEGP
ncbi:hypothetical protein ACPYOC_10000 [Ornithinimicrobium sp. W1665]|uniref:hypothetical protein n=2 Tax=Ornithinimicrobium sp. W1665 TaxID=3416666 RepID=UPI003CF55927